MAATMSQTAITRPLTFKKKSLTMTPVPIILLLPAVRSATTTAIQMNTAVRNANAVTP